MPEVQLNDRVFEAARRRAAAAGYSNVEEYVSDVVVRDITESGENLDRLFTPERLASLERISGEIKSGGKIHTMDEAAAHFDERRRGWLARHRT